MPTELGNTPLSTSVVNTGDLSGLALDTTLQRVATALEGQALDERYVMLPYVTETSGITLLPYKAVYKADMASDGTFPSVTDTSIPTSDAYYQFELELTVPDTVPSTITGPSGWTWIDGHGLPDPADLSGGETICISVRLDCTARTFLASVWRVA